jgi:hypothetical protein
VSAKANAGSIRGTSLGTANRAARVAGLLYLAHFVAFFIADNGVHYTAVGPMTATTANQIMTSEWLFRIGFVSFLLAALFFLSAAWALYVLLESVDKNLALLFLLLNLAGVVLQCASLSSEFGAYLILSGADYLKAFPAEASQALAMLFLSMYKNGFMGAQIFLALWVLPLGYLVIRSGYLPKLLGAFLVVDCLVLLIWVFQFFLVYPENEAVSGICLAISFIAEASLCVWLLIKGVNVQKWEKHALEVA